MNAIPNSLGKFDFLWSCCAIEHLGSLEHGMIYILDANKCLVPGGIAIHTTELILIMEMTLQSHWVFHCTEKMNSLNQSDVRLNKVILLYHSTGIRVTYQKIYIDLPPYEEKTHLKLMIKNFVLTQYGIILIKGSRCNSEFSAIAIMY